MGWIDDDTSRSGITFSPITTAPTSYLILDKYLKHGCQRPGHGKEVGELEERENRLVYDTELIEGDSLC